MKQRDKYLLAIIGVVVLAGGFWMLMLKPKRAELSDVTKQVQEKQASIDTLKAQTVNATEAKVDYAATYATMARLGRAVPPKGSVDDDIPSLLLQVNQGANITRTAFFDYEPVESEQQAAPAATPPPAEGSAPADGAAAGTTGDASAAGAAGATSTAAAPTPSNYKVSFRGSFFDLENLLNYMTNMVTVKGNNLKVSGRLITINSVDFTVIGVTSNGTPRMKAEMEFSGYTTDGNPLEGATPAAPPGTDPAQPQTASDPAAAGSTTPPASVGRP